jgi:hypothetical protein
VKHKQAPNIIPVGEAWDFKKWLSCRPVTLQSWTDQHVFRFSKGVDGHAQMHYKYFSKSPAYMGFDPMLKVASFKRLASEDRSAPGTAHAHRGIPMPHAIPEGDPCLAKAYDWSMSEQALQLIKYAHFAQYLTCYVTIGM